MRLRRLLFILLALALITAACSTDDSEDGGGEGGGEGAAAAECEPGDTDGDLVLYNWSEYIDPELITKFEEQYGVSVTEDFFPSNEDMLAKVSSGASGYDVVVPSDYMVGIMVEEGLLAELQTEAIPNLTNLDPDFTDLPFDPEGKYSVPYQWGTTGIAVDTNEVGEDFEQSWGLIFDPAQADAYAGRISMLNDPREALGAALKYLGYSLNTTNPDELAEAQDLLTETTERLATYDSDQFEDLLVGGETVVAQGWSGDFFRAFDEASTDDFDAYERYTYFVPEEGGVRWVDNMVILADAPHPCTAHTFIDFMLDAENGAALTNFNFYASPNAAAEEFIDTEILEDPAIYPPEEVAANLEFIEDTGDFETQYSDAFTQAKG